tara:strand:- start:345 stop:1253 length:909 start_codon:yes stop_codon:yes gene_type:complete
MTKKDNSIHELEKLPKNLGSRVEGSRDFNKQNLEKSLMDVFINFKKDYNLDYTDNLRLSLSFDDKKPKLNQMVYKDEINSTGGFIFSDKSELLNFDIPYNQKLAKNDLTKLIENIVNQMCLILITKDCIKNGFNPFRKSNKFSREFFKYAKNTELGKLFYEIYHYDKFTDKQKSELDKGFINLNLIGSENDKIGIDKLGNSTQEKLIKSQVMGFYGRYIDDDTKQLIKSLMVDSSKFETTKKKKTNKRPFFIVTDSDTKSKIGEFRIPQNMVNMIKDGSVYKMQREKNNKVVQSYEIKIIKK